MSDLLSIGSGGVQVYQRALATTSNNIANTATEGYSRQEATIVDNAPRQIGPHWLGTGSLVESIGRNYDAFIEQSLRTSISELETQTPLIDYIDRVVDILGSQTTGLTGALDNFFAAARSLSTDAASPELRASFLSNAEGLAQRLRTLGGQLGVLDTETSEAVRTQLDSINRLARQLANVNSELNRKGLLARQAPRLLDERDALLRELSSLVKIRVVESRSGAVDVSIGTTDRRGKIVEGTNARQLDSVIDPQTLDVKLILDPRGKYEVVTGVSSGSLGGLLNFRDQILAPSVAQLDFLAQTIASQFNAVHGSGMDAKGNLGGDLFTIDPVFTLRAEASTADLAVRWEVINPAETKFHSVRLEFNPDQGVWKATDVETGKSVTGGTDLIINGMRISVDGRPESAESVLLDASNRPALGIRSLPEDPRLVAAAAPFRVIEDPLNPSGSDATIEWRPDQSDLNPLKNLSEYARSNSWQTNANLVDLSGGRPYKVLGALTAGSRDIDLGIISDPSSPVEIEIFTRDGRHIAGSPLADTEWSEIMGIPESGGEGRATGFVTGATYSRQYKNLSGTLGYLGMSIFRGVRSLSTEFDLSLIHI